MSQYNRVRDLARFYEKNNKIMEEIYKKVRIEKNYNLMTGFSHRQREMENYKLQFKNGSKYMK